MKLTVSLDENLYKQAVDTVDIADQAELLNQALEALLESKGTTPIRTAVLRAQEDAAQAEGPLPLLAALVLQLLDVALLVIDLFQIVQGGDRRPGNVVDCFDANVERV